MNNNKEKKCWACGKAIIGKSKFGLCKRCSNNGKNGILPIIGAVLWFGVKKAAPVIKEVLKKTI